MADDDEKQRVIFEQNCQDFRSLNEIMWKIPIIVITLTGGLWFGVGSIDISNNAKTALLILTGTANVIFILVLIRLRYVMNQILKGIKIYQGLPLGRGYVFVFLFSMVLAVAAIVSFYAAVSGSVFYKKSPTDVTGKKNDTPNKAAVGKAAEER
jgi:hypothetical protein